MGYLPGVTKRKLFTRSHSHEHWAHSTYEICASALLIPADFYKHHGDRHANVGTITSFAPFPSPDNTLSYPSSHSNNNIIIRLRAPQLCAEKLNGTRHATRLQRRV